ncbi:MAG: PfkB family carbohydrate kinase [Bacteroides sp.]|jgi:nucleoside 2-deoxyribosyltransferase|nr:PfkB family carbohydrate kinase [Bacteroides sp.]MCI1681115.1 PfkB family carbohydrate kinase [Bacteroides sp.]
MLHVIGGSYIECCQDPVYFELYGSGLRATIALSNYNNIKKVFHTCIDHRYSSVLLSISKINNFEIDKTCISKNIEFLYYHPLSSPVCINEPNKRRKITPKINTNENVLYYGLVEADYAFQANYLVYDPQNQRLFETKNCKASHLALVLNKNEALLLSKVKSKKLEVIGESIMKTENAEVVIIKNGTQGALVIEKNSIKSIPVFETASVWPIGSGDIFTAIFAFKWIYENLNAFEAASQASLATAQYCQFKKLPLEKDFFKFNPLKPYNKKRRVYIAGPFFSIAERWLINETRQALVNFGNKVFSPMHDVGIIPNIIPEEEIDIAQKDLQGLRKSDVILAIVSNLDPGTLFEIGYARALKKKIIILAQNVNKEDLLMMVGTGCEITDNFSTAIYKASW